MIRDLQLMECMEINTEGKAEVLEAAAGEGAQGRAGQDKDTANKPLKCSWRLQQAEVHCTWTPHEQSDTFTGHLGDSEGGIPNPDSSDLP